MRGNLEYRIGGRVDNRRAGAHVFFAELVEDHRARRRLVAERLSPNAFLVLFDHVRRKSVRVCAKRIGNDESHHFPMSGRRIFPRAHFVHAPERRRRRNVGRRLRQRVQQPESAQCRQRRMLRLQNMPKRVGTFVAEVFRIRQLANAEGVADEENGSPSH